MAMRATQEVEDLRPSAEKHADVDWSAALAFVGRLQNQDAADRDQYGGFGYNPGGERGGTAGGR